MSVTELLQNTNGIIFTQKALNHGISKYKLYNFLRKQNFEKVAHGVYAAPDEWLDEEYLIHQSCPNAVFSHESALYHHGLIDREPMQHNITIYSGYNPQKLKARGIKVYTIKKELLDVGKECFITDNGYKIPMYNLERTICDLFRSRNKIEIQDFQTAVKSYVGRRDKDLNKLMHYAELFRISKIVRQYMEVLL